LRIFNWNVHKANRYDSTLYAQVQKMASYNPDVITLQEVDGWGREGKYAEALTAQTGQQWYYRWSSNDYAGNRAGPAILSKIPFDSTETRVVGCDTWGQDYRAVIRGKITKDGKSINVYSVHFDFPQDDGTCRLQNAQNLLGFMNESSILKIASGDYNASTTGSSLEQLTLNLFTNAGYTEACTDIFGSPYSCPDTKGGWRPDTAFRSGSGIHTIRWDVLPLDSTTDHQAIIEDYQF
jgi:endonuclease/exonuclease/phosphatase family metal-dependent hydrolase